MKPSPRDYFAIIAAFLAVLLCGYGIGFLVGERTTRQRLAHADGSSQTQPDWSAATVERLTRQLSLTAAQQTAVASEVRLTATTIATTRHQEADLDSDGALSYEEFILLPGMAKKLVDKPDVVVAIFDRLDTDDSGAISLEEFLACVKQCDQARDGTGTGTGSGK